MSHHFEGSGRYAALSALTLALTTCAIFIQPSLSHAQQGTVTLTGHIPRSISRAVSAQRINASERITLALALPLRNQPELTDLLSRLSDPEDALYGNYLTPAEFTARFGPTMEDYNRVVNFAKAKGLTIVGTHPNRTLLDVAATASTVERAFGVRLLRYQMPDGSIHRAPDVEPSIPTSLQGRLSGIVGLEDAVRRPHNILRQDRFPGTLGLQPHAGSGPNGGYSPADIKTAYNLNGLSVNGTGQTLGLFELDGYTASDVTAYENYFSLPHVALQNILVDGASGGAGSGAGEVTLDIELQVALAQGATKVIVYEGPNSSAGVVDTYNRIATDNLAKQISTSWGLYESGNSSSSINSENTAFQQMAAQGQSIYAAAGDSGAYDNGTSLSVDDPASQPYVVGVGGTSMTTNGAGGSYSSETTWNGGSVSAGAGGGGISSLWSIPSYQSGVITSASKGSTTKRNVPDVSLNADPNTGYAIYYGSRWVVYGGTSCAAPLWSAFNALVNQQRIANGSAVLGFPNTPIYAVGKGSSYTTDFHDIANNSTNLYYPAVTGFDDATGWGTFNGTNLLTALAGPSGPPTIPAPPTGLTATAGSAQIALAWNASSGATTYNLYRATTSGAEVSYKTGLTGTTITDTGLTNGTTYYYKVTATNSAGTSGFSSEASATPVVVSQLLGNPGFENGSSNPSPWVPTAGVIDNSSSEPAHSGSWKAWLDGYGTRHTDTLYQQVTIPSTISSATLTFWLHIDTAETTTTTAYDTLKVQILNSSGTVLSTLATYSNLNKNSGYAQKSFNLTAYKGQTIRIYLIGVEDSSLQTSFVVDDFALNVQ